MAAFESELARCPIFQQMSADECQEVLNLVEHETYPAGEIILREGRSVQILWIVVHGRCEVLKTMNDGTEQQLATLDPGAVFGEMSFFHPAPHSASVRTLTEVEVLRLTRQNYNALEQTGSKAAHKIAASTAIVLAERLRQMDQWVCEFVERPESVNHREEWREFRSKLYSDWQF